MRFSITTGTDRQIDKDTWWFSQLREIKHGEVDVQYLPMGLRSGAGRSGE